MDYDAAPEPVMPYEYIDAVPSADCYGPLLQVVGIGVYNFQAVGVYMYWDGYVDYE